MRRFFLILEYDGGPYVGWQRQANGRSIQQALEEAVEKFCQQKTTAAAAGRTDAGVHALGMPAHIDIDVAASADTVRDAINFHLRPEPIAVLAAREAPESLHARFSAVARHYAYIIVPRRAPLAIQVGKAWRITAPLNVDAMHRAAQVLIGRHDFTTFRAAQCQSKSPVKSMDDVAVKRVADRIEVTASARSFLHHQIRSIVGSLVEVGVGKWTEGDFAAALAAKDRTACGPVAPPDGLYFVRADYPTDQALG